MVHSPAAEQPRAIIDEDSLRVAQHDLGKPHLMKLNPLASLNAAFQEEENGKEAENGSDEPGDIANDSSRCEAIREEDNHSVPVTDYPNTADDSTELPLGWRRMIDDSGVYYWHVESGDITRQRPTSGSPVNPPSLSPYNKSPTKELPNSHSEMLHLSSSMTMASLSQSSSNDLSRVVDALDESQDDSLVFPVRGLGCIVMEDEELRMDSSLAISAAIRNICHSSEVEETDVESLADKDLLLILEDQSLRVCDYLDNAVLFHQPMWQIRLWGVGKDSGRDFAFVVKERASGRHKCYAFRSDRSAKAISAAMQKVCDKIVAERAAKRRSLPANPFLQQSFTNKSWNDNEPMPAVPPERPKLTGTPLDRITHTIQQSVPPPSDDVERFQVLYIGSMPAEKPNGIASINEAISDLRDIGDEEYTPAVVNVSPSTILITNSHSGSLITESRVRYLSFLGIGKDPCKFGYIVSTCRNQFICHVLHCEPSAGPLAKAIESACKVRYQKVLEQKKRQLLAPPGLTRQNTMPAQSPSIGSTTGYIRNSMYSLFDRFSKFRASHQGRTSMDEETDPGGG